MDTGALCSSWQVVWCGSWRENLIDNMDDSVAGIHVCKGYICTVHHNTCSYGKAERLPVNSVGGHALCDCRSRNCAGDDVVKQDVSKGCLSFRGIKRCEVNACICKCLVGRRKERKRSVALEGFQQLCLDDCSHERVVDASALCSTWNIVWC